MLKKILVLISFIALGLNLKASHTMGADISYRYIGPNQYEVTLSFYRDCGGASTPGGCDYTFNASCTGVSGSSCSSSGPIYFYMRSATCGYCIKDEFNNPPVITEVTPICASGSTKCTGGSNPGVQQWKLTKIVTLPAQCTDWQFIYGSYARNSAITTLTSTSVGMFVSASLNNVAAPTNSSPTFANLPVPWLCVNQPFCYNQGVTEPNGDSLFYSLTTPLKDVNGTTVSYAAPYSATNPLASSPALTLDSKDGDICFTPTQIQVTVMAIKVSEYRNGVFVGSTVRDIQITVINCTNQPPVLSGIDGTSNYTKTVCAGTQLCFDITSSDPDAANLLTMSWNSGIPGATFTITNNNTATPTGRFCWTPSGSDVRPQPYVFSALVKDNACLYYATQAKAYNINVISCGPTVSTTSSSVCPGACNNVTATGTGGTGPYNYSWNPGSGTGSSFNVCPASTTTYTVITTDNTGATASNTAIVTVNSAPAPTISGTTTICAGKVTTLTANGGGTYLWNTSATTAAITVSPATNTTYTVTVTTGGCTGSKTVAVTVNPNPAPTISGNTTICAGTGTTLTANGGGTYLWSTTATSPSITVSPAGNTTYSVTVTNNGCTGTANVVVTVAANLIPVITGTTTICNGASTTLSTSGGGTYSWSDGSNGSSITVTPTTPTSYSVTVTNGSCSGTASVQVTVVDNPTPTISGNTSVCPGTGTTLTANGGSTYIWDNGQTTANITVSPSSETTYTVTANTSGCTGQTTVVVNITPPPAPTISGTTAICTGGTATLTATAGGTYAWSTGETTAAITVTPAGTSTYTVIVTTGCSTSATIQVTVQANLTPAIAGNTIICTGASTTLSTGGGSTYAWNDGSTTSAITVSPTSPTSYSVTVTSGLCSGTASVQVNVNPLPAPTITGASTICSGAGATLTANAGGAYAWSTGQTTAAITVSPSTTTTYTVVVTNAGCTGSATAEVIVNPTPAPVISNTSPICSGQSAMLTTTGTTGPYIWSTGETTSSITVSPAATQTYTVSVTAGGCTGTATQTVIVIPPVVASIQGRNICIGENVTLTGSGGDDYLWINNGSITNPIIETPLATTTYTMVTSVGTCTDTAFYTVTVNPLPTPIASGDTTIMYGQSTQLKSGGGGSYQWIPPTGLNCTNCASPTASPTATTHYCVIVTTSGCSDSACVTVIVDLKCGFEGEVFVPNGFSPNGDGQNDVLYVRGLGITDMYWSIFDRWGEKVFETNDFTQGWNGKYKGKELDPAVFVYYLEVTCITGDVIKQKGNVAIIK